MADTCELDIPSQRIYLAKELRAQGITDQGIAMMVRRGELHRVRHGAYVEGPVWASLDELGQHALKARAVVKQAKVDVVLSHVSALPEYDAPHWGIELDDVHVTRPDRRGGRHERGVRQHSGELRTNDVVTRDVQVTSATRLGVDITTVASVEPSLCVVNHLLHQNLTSRAELRKASEFMNKWPNTLNTDLVLSLTDPRIESVAESRSFYLCWRQGLPMPQPQYPIVGRDGRVIAYLDFAWPERRCFMEVDGRVKYLQPYDDRETVADVLLRERRRQEWICQVTGWRCIRIVWADLARPVHTARRIRSLLDDVEASA